MLEEHYKNNYKKLCQKAGRILKDMHYGEDATQDAYEKAMKYLPTFDVERGNFEQWFSRIYSNSVNRYINYMRDKGIVKEIKLTDVEIPVATLLEINSGMVEKEIAMYNEDCREILTLLVLRGYTSTEVGHITNTNPNNVLKISQRFKTYLKKKYTE